MIKLSRLRWIGHVDKIIEDRLLIQVIHLNIYITCIDSYVYVRKEKPKSQ